MGTLARLLLARACPGSRQGGLGLVWKGKALASYTLPPTLPAWTGRGDTHTHTPAPSCAPLSSSVVEPPPPANSDHFCPLEARPLCQCFCLGPCLCWWGSRGGLRPGGGWRLCTREYQVALGACSPPHCTHLLSQVPLFPESSAAPSLRAPLLGGAIRGNPRLSVEAAQRIWGGALSTAFRCPSVCPFCRLCCLPVSERSAWDACQGHALWPLSVVCPVHASLPSGAGVCACREGPTLSDLQWASLPLTVLACGLWDRAFRRAWLGRCTSASKLAVGSRQKGSCPGIPLPFPGVGLSFPSLPSLHTAQGSAAPLLSVCGAMGLPCHGGGQGKQPHPMGVLPQGALSPAGHRVCLCVSAWPLCSHPVAPLSCVVLVVWCLSVLPSVCPVAPCPFSACGSPGSFACWTLRREGALCPFSAGTGRNEAGLSRRSPVPSVPPPLRRHSLSRDPCVPPLSCAPSLV